MNHRTFVFAAILLSACTTESVMSPRPGVELSRQPVATTTVAAPAPVAVAPKTRLVGFVSRPLNPRSLMSQAEIMPRHEVACRRNLKRMGVRFRELAPIDDGGGCGIPHPIEVTGLSGGVRIKPAAKLNCAMAATFAKWVRKDLAPATRLRYLSGIRTIHQGSSYSCRSMNNRRGARLSEHAKGNALDIMKITLKSGREIDVRKPGLFAFRHRAVLNNVRGDACKYFSTVLGPGYDRNHRDHFHFDIMNRKGRSVCK